MDPVDLSHIFSSRARFLVLQVVAPLTQGLGLREIERQTHLNTRSVQVATQSLIAEKILKKGSKGLLRLNSKSSAAKVLRGMFNYLRDEKIRESAEALSARAKRILELSDEVASLVKNARRVD